MCARDIVLCRRGEKKNQPASTRFEFVVPLSSSRNLGRVSVWCWSEQQQLNVAAYDRVLVLPWAVYNAFTSTTRRISLVDTTRRRTVKRYTLAAFVKFYRCYFFFFFIITYFVSDRKKKIYFYYLPSRFIPDTKIIMVSSLPYCSLDHTYGSIPNKINNVPITTNYFVPTLNFTLKYYQVKPYGFSS